MSVKNLPLLVRSHARRYGPKPAVLSLREGSPVELTWIDLKNAAWAVARKLVDGGLPAEGTVALLEDGSPEALAAEIGVHAAAGVAVLLDPNLPPPVLGSRLLECQARVLLVPPGLGPVAEAAGRAAEGRPVPLPLDRLVPGPADARPPEDGTDDPVIEARLDLVGPETPSTAMHTRGTARGVRLAAWSQINLLGNASAVAVALQAADDDTWLALGSPAHPFLRAASVYPALASAGTLCLPPGDGDPLQAFWLARPSFLALRAEDLPALADRLRTELDGLPGIQGRLARWAVRVGAEGAGNPPKGWTGRLADAAAEALVRSRVLEVVGGRLRAVVAGWGPIPPHPAALFAGLRVSICASWGLTEGGGVTTLARPGARAMGTEGRPLEGTELRVDPSGEVRQRGAGVMFSYHLLSPRINDDLAGGWLRTGDRGRIEPDGTFTYLGRMEGGYTPAAALQPRTVRTDAPDGPAVQAPDPEAVDAPHPDGEVPPAGGRSPRPSN